MISLSEEKREKVALQKGFFITFEGEDCTGKSTQIRRLYSFLKQLDIESLLTREPGGTAGAELVRHVLLSDSVMRLLGRDMEAFLFSAARLDHIEEVIRPAINLGKIVLCDRFLDSSRVYQSMANSYTHPTLLSQLEHVCVKDMLPDLTLIFDLSPEEALKRSMLRRKKDENPDRFESANLETHYRRYHSFLEIARKEPDRCRIINASGSQEEVQERVFNVVFQALEKHFQRPFYWKKVKNDS